MKPQPGERLSQQRDEILAPGARLQGTRNERGGTREVAVRGNRKDLRALAAIGSGLAELATEVR
jgi:hypothetical protein